MPVFRRRQPVPHYFPTRSAWRSWLKRNHAVRSEQWVKLFKQRVGRGLRYPEAVEEALCFGWIDGQLRRIDDRAHTLRFSPRKPGSTWAASNIARMKRLRKAGKMTPAGLAVFTSANSRQPAAPDRRMISSLIVPKDLAAALRKNRRALVHFRSYPPSNRRIALGWVRSAKKPETRMRRIRNIVANAAKHPKPQF